MDVKEIISKSGRPYGVNHTISKRSFDKWKLKVSEIELVNRTNFDNLPLKLNNLLVLSADFLSQPNLNTVFKVLEKYYGEVDTKDLDFRISDQLTYLFLVFDTPTQLEEAFLDLSN